MFPGYKFVMVPDYTVPVPPPPPAPVPVVIQQQAAPRAAPTYTKKGKKKVTFDEPPFIGPLLPHGARNMPPSPFIGPLARNGTRGYGPSNVFGRSGNTTMTSGGSGTPSDMSRMDLDESSIGPISHYNTPIRPSGPGPRPGSSLANTFAFLNNQQEPLLHGFQVAQRGAYADPRIPKGFRGVEIDPKDRMLLYKPTNFYTRNMRVRERFHRDKRRARNEAKKQLLQNKPYGYREATI